MTDTITLTETPTPDGELILVTDCLDEARRAAAQDRRDHPGASYTMASSPSPMRPTAYYVYRRDPDPRPRRVPMTKPELARVCRRFLALQVTGDAR